MAGAAYEIVAERQESRRAVSVTGITPQTNVERNVARETFSIDEARTAMGIPWMVMRDLSQAIPPAYGKWIGEQAMNYLLSLEPPPEPAG